MLVVNKKTSLSIYLAISTIVEIQHEFLLLCFTRVASRVARQVKNLPAMQQTLVQSLSWEDSLEKRMALILRIPVFLPWEFHGQRSLAGYVHGVAKSWTRLKWLTLLLSECNKYVLNSIQLKNFWWDFPGGPAAKTGFPKQGTWVWFLVRELDPTGQLRPQSSQIKKKKRKKKELQMNKEHERKIHRRNAND